MSGRSMLRMQFSDKPRHVMRRLLANCDLSDDGLGVLEEKQKLLLHEYIARQQLRMTRRNCVAETGQHTCWTPVTLTSPREMLKALAVSARTSHSNTCSLDAFTPAWERKTVLS